MKKLSISLLAALMLFNFAGCKKDEANKTDEAKPEAAADAPKDYCSTVTADSLKALAKMEDKNGKQVLTADSYAEILNALQCCTIDEKSFALNRKECVAYQVVDGLQKDKVLLPATQAVMAKLVKSESPIVRAEGYKAMSSIFGANKDQLNIGKEAIQNEKDPYALTALVAGLSNEGNKDPDVGKFLISMSKHEDVHVRRKAANAIANSWSDKVEGVADAVIAMFDDADENAAGLACEGAGKIAADDKVIEAIVKILNDDSKVKLHAHCVKGLAWMWLDFPQHKRHNEAAYKATMDYLKKSPRTNEIPVWNAVSAFCTVANTGNAFDNWKKEATWFKMDDFSAAMVDLIKDDNFNWLGKPPAMKAIASFGGKAELEKIKPVIDGVSDQKVKDAYDKELASAK